MDNRITKLFNIDFPIVQGGMVWCSGWKLATAVSECGGLGLIGAGSMYPDVFREHIQKAKNATSKPFGVNIPLLYPDVDQLMEIVKDEGVKIVFTSAGSPKKWTPFLKDLGITVVHVVSSSVFAAKSEQAGVDAVVAEGFEAGGHNGREETTSLVLIPEVVKRVSIPVLAAGGIGSGQSIVAAMALGADGVQIGSLFAATTESSAHSAFKNQIYKAIEGDTKLTLKQLAPVRLLKNKFFNDITEAQKNCATVEELKSMLGKGRAKKGMFEGDLDEGELEIGQISSDINEEQTVAQVFNKLRNDYKACCKKISKLKEF